MKSELYMKIFRILIVLTLVSITSFSQKNAGIEEVDVTEKTLRDPVTFTHVPFLLLKITPSAMLGYNNVFQYGGEIVPPFGKFSFSFDYGKGKGSQNASKYIRQNQSGNQNKMIRGEIRMYFSDWYPFYALDKKPFGRYYAIEYAQSQSDKDLQMATGVGGAFLPSFAKFNQVKYSEKTQAIHLKIGKHIHLHRYLFLDVFAGAGIGKFSSDAPQDLEADSMPLHYSFLTNKNLRNPGTSGYYLSTTAGFRLALPL